MKKTFMTAVLTWAVFAFSSGAFAASPLGASPLGAASSSPIYVVDAAGDHGVNSLDDAFTFLVSTAVPDNGVLSVRICQSVAVTGDVSVDLSGKTGLADLIIEGGSFSGGASHPRDDTSIQVSGIALASGAAEPANAAGIADVTVKLPAEAILEVRNLRFSDCIQFDGGTGFAAPSVVTVHDCQIDGGWYVVSPASESYVFANNQFSSGFGGAAVALYYGSAQTHDLDVDFRGNKVSCFRALETSTGGNDASDAKTNVRVADNVFVHSTVTKSAYDQLDAAACRGLCAITGKVNGDVEIYGNKVLGYFDSAAALLASGSVAAGSNVAVTNNDYQCNVREVSFDAEAATVSDNRKVHLYPAETADHSSVCHICTACKDAIYRVEVTNGRIDSGAEKLLVVTNYSGYGFELSAKTTPNAFALSVGKTNDVVCTGYEDGLQSYWFEGLAVDMNFTDWPWPHTDRQYTLSSINNDAAWGAVLVRCPLLRVTFKQKYVSSANFHASVKVDAATTNVLIAVPWTFYTPDGSSSSNLPVNRLVRPVNLCPGDMLLNVRDSKVFESWMLVVADYDKEVLEWVAAKSITGNTRVPSDKVDLEDKPSAEKPIPRGTGLWLVRTNPQTEGGEWLPFYLYGQWAKGGALVTVDGPAEGMEENAVMIAHPGCMRELVINSDIRWQGVEAGDTLSIPNGTDAPDLAEWDVEKGQWWISKTVRDGRRVISVQDYDITVPAGQGFWYVRRAPTPVSIEFVEK